MGPQRAPLPSRPTNHRSRVQRGECLQKLQATSANVPTSAASTDSKATNKPFIRRQRIALLLDSVVQPAVL